MLLGTCCISFSGIDMLWKFLVRVALHFLQILSVWQNWLIFKPDTIIITYQLVLSGIRVKYLDHEKRAYKHEIWSYSISEKASYNRSFWRVQRDWMSKSCSESCSTCILCLCEKRKPWQGHACMQARRSLRHTPRTIISCADQFIVR